jgi:predicted transcriptional regulator
VVVENLEVSGRELRAMLANADVDPMVVCLAARCSISSLYKILRDDPKDPVGQRLRGRVVRTILDFDKNAKASA